MLKLAAFRRTHQGHTLVGLVTGCALAAILAGLALPRLGTFVARHRLAVIGNEMQALFTLARREALYRGERVTVCRSTNPMAELPACAPPGTAWQGGVIVFVDALETGPQTAPQSTAPGRPQPASRAHLLRVRAPLPPGYRIERRGASGPISFAANGRLKGGTIGASFELIGPTATTAADTATAAPGSSLRHCIIIAITGRTRIDDRPCD